MNTTDSYEAGTLGRFTIRLKGTVTKSNDGKTWKFVGEMQFYDTYDFETSGNKNETDDEGMPRQTWADDQVKFAKKYLPGKPFEVSSEWISITQDTNTKTGDYFDWFIGKNQEAIPSKITKGQEKETKEKTTSSN